jgi:hypothetical protein
MRGLTALTAAKPAIWFPSLYSLRENSGLGCSERLDGHLAPHSAGRMPTPSRSESPNNSLRLTRRAAAALMLVFPAGLA